MVQQEEISPVQFLNDITEWLRESPEGLLSAKEVYSRVEQKYREHFTTADKRRHKLPNGKTRPKWMNNVDWAKAIGAKNKVLATVRHKNQNWVMMLNEVSSEWKERAQKKRKRKCFKKRCPSCKKMIPIQKRACEYCGKEFAAPNQKRRL